MSNYVLDKLIALKTIELLLALNVCWVELSHFVEIYKTVSSLLTMQLLPVKFNYIQANPSRERAR